MNNQLIQSKTLSDTLIDWDEKFESEFETAGKELLSKNNFFKDLSELIKDEKFTNFYNNYMKNLDEIKTTFIYIKLYKLFEKRYKNLTGKELSQHVIMYLLYSIMCNSKLRPLFLQSTLKNLENPSKPILKITPQIKKSKKKKVSFAELNNGVNYII